MLRGGLLIIAVALTTGLAAGGAAGAIRPQPAQPPQAYHSSLIAPVEPKRSASTCRKWRSLAARLGETYAGHKLRHTVATRLCAMSAPAAEEDVWGWPWRSRDVRVDLPPLRHGRYGAWEIRCGEFGRRRRCALTLETEIVAGDRGSEPPVRVVSSVVIDTVAGRESVLWRVHVAREPGGAAPGGGIAMMLAGREAIEPFDACGHRGCISEADTKVSAEVTSWLWSGKPVGLSLGVAGAGRFEGALTADGFSRGFSELIRLRRHEGRSLAGR